MIEKSKLFIKFIQFFSNEDQINSLHKTFPTCDSKWNQVIGQENKMTTMKYLAKISLWDFFFPSFLFVFCVLTLALIYFRKISRDIKKKINFVFKKISLFRIHLQGRVFSFWLLLKNVFTSFKCLLVTFLVNSQSSPLIIFLEIQINTLFNPREGRADCLHSTVHVKEHYIWINFSESICTCDVTCLCHSN